MIGKLFISQGIKDLGQMMMVTPHEWSQSEYYFTNKKRGISVWTANECYGLKINGLPHLNWFERRYINKCIQQTIANKLIDNGIQ